MQATKDRKTGTEATAAAAPVTEPPLTRVSEATRMRLDEGLSWDSCGPLQQQRPNVGPTSNQQIQIEADGSEFLLDEEVYQFSGDVEITSGEERSIADRARYDRKTNRVDAQGNVFYERQGLRFTSTRADLDLETDQGWLENVDYRLIQSNARGQAEKVFVETPTLSHFQNITYTTCRPGKDDWLLEADDLTIDQESGLGTAHDAKLRFMDVPVFYTPYFRFPIDDRRMTGFLTPTFGSTETTGADFSLPYYINIAPNMDATLTPRIMSKRGLMLGGEFRYLRPNYSGEILGEILPDDRDHSEQESSTRGQISFQHRRRLAPGWGTDIDVHWVSDDNYLTDFGDTLNVASTRNVQQRGTVYYQGDGVRFSGLVQHFNTIDEDISTQDQPYARLPQLLLVLDRPDQALGLSYHMKGEYDYFDHDSKVHGHRLTLKPGVSLPLRRSYGHLIPKVSLDYTTYRLTDTAAGDPDSPSRTLPTASLDGGLIFERGASWFGTATSQTLEPRLFYLFTPHDDQGDLPAFDTTNLDLSFNNMFRENRFTGQDRIGDANQVTLALTSRTRDDTSGRELFHASLGQIYYFRDRKVQLPGVTEQDDVSSVIIAEAATQLTSTLSARANLTWNPHADGSKRREKNSAEIHYQGAGERLVNLVYRFNRGTPSNEENTRFEDVDLSMRWPLTPNLRFVGRWDYSPFLEKTVEAFGGFEYGSCCWTLRAIARHFITSGNGDENTIYMVQLELSGLGKLGNKVEDFLAQGIHGYRRQ